MTPTYLEDLSFEEYKEAVYHHIYDIVDQYKNEIKIWNSMAEPMHPWATVLGLDKEQKIEVTKVAVQAVREADPEAQITIRFCLPHENTPYSFLQDAIDAGITFHVVGLHLHYNSDLSAHAQTIEGLPDTVRSPRLSLSSQGELIDKYSLYDKKIFISEFSTPSAHIEGREDYWGQPWNQELQAEYLAAAYTIFFSKPQVQAIIWWNITDKRAWAYGGGLLDEQNASKTAYYALKDLIQSWTTSGTGVTDEKGQVSFRGFGGTYEVLIRDTETGLSKKQEITVEEQKDNLITIVLD